LNEFESLTQTCFNLSLRIQDTVFLAEQAADHYQTNVDRIVDRMEDHIGGAAVGNVLVRNAYVMRANERFQELLVVTYKMAAAFIHSYNLDEHRSRIMNQLYRVTTPGDVRELIRELELREAQYCGGAAIDCDAPHNIGSLRVSLRDEIFPQLVDQVSSTGAVLTKGEQFHRAIASAPYIRTRERAGRVVEQIELPFSVSLLDRGPLRDADERWMISPLECNHIVSGGGRGTFAVNVIGSRLHNLKFEMHRGPIDQLRACEATVREDIEGRLVRDYPVNLYTVGFAPHAPDAQLDSPAEYTSHTNGLLACKNEPERGGNYVTEERCYQYFARDRSLASNEWKVVIPVDSGFGNEWIVDDLVEEPAVIEDIVIYFRYRTRPI
jgi:hypothetical protein